MYKDYALHWQETWSIDIVSIDQEHKLLIKLFNDLLEALDENRNLNEVTQRYQDLVDHTREHFSHEELVMRNIGYGKYRDHKSAHDTILERVAEISRLLEGEVLPEAVEDLCQELNKALVIHLREFDLGIKGHLQYGH